MPKYSEGGVVDNDDLENDRKGGGHASTALIAVFIVLIWIAIFIMLIKLDVGGFGSSVLYPILKDVPVLNVILPETEESGSLNSNTGESFSTLQQAIDRINELENELAVYRQSSDTNSEKISQLTAEIERLRTYEYNQVKYETDKRKFDEEIVYTPNAPSIDVFANWYEQMDPDNAAEIYKQVQEQLAMDEQILQLAKEYSSMKPANAAAIMEEMTGDMEKVAKLLNCMKPAESGAILAAMNSTYAAKITLLMYPTNETYDGK